MQDRVKACDDSTSSYVYNVNRKFALIVGEQMWVSEHTWSRLSLVEGGLESWQLYPYVAVWPGMYSWEESAAVVDYKPPAQIHIINRVKSLCSR